MSLTTGFHLAGRYRLLSRIAAGGMGEVWEAEDSRLGRRVAIKVLKPELTGDPEFRQRFHTEAQLTASLNHPGIAGVYDYGEAPGTAAAPGRYPEPDTAYLVMELVDGDSLAAILAREHRLSPDRTLDVLGQAAAALNAAHGRGLVHRDVKPGNILITPAGQVKLTDFGIAKAVDAAPVTRQGMVMGTAHYIAPEQAAGDEAGPASDIYSLGVVGYECLAGERPFQSDNPLAIAMMHVNEAPPPLPGDVPDPVRMLVAATLVKDPWQRYRSGGDFGAAVDTVRLGRRPPLPGGMDAATATALTSVINEAPEDHYPPQTALLLPGQSGATRYDDTRYDDTRYDDTRYGDTAYGAGSGTGYGPPAAPPPRSGRYVADYPDEPEPRRRSAARTAIVVALLGVIALVVGSYAIREALLPGTAAPGSSATPQQPPPPATTGPAPAEPTTEPPPTTEAPAPPVQDDQGDQGGSEQQTTAPTEDKPDTVFVVPTDYVGRSGSEAAATAKEKHLKPRVVDEQGDKVGSDQQADCEVKNVDPAAGFVPRGSTLVLTCGSAG